MVLENPSRASPQNVWLSLASRCLQGLCPVSPPSWIPAPQLARGQTWAQCWEPATAWMSFRGGWPGAPPQIRALNLPRGREPGGMRHRLLGREGTEPPENDLSWGLGEPEKMWEIWGGAWWGSMVEAGAETWGELMRGLQVVPSLGHTLL